ncbi:MAG: 3-deoxy-D-manno-octulosonic acid transferase [Candidatus Jettenia sp. CY-1]|nr:MAG: 3-deoxy-D-manno-octulosonic acid transferase [Candidatus Jettenia sp. CY-1]
MPTIFDVIYVTALILGSPYLLVKFITSKRHRSGLLQRLGWITIKQEKKSCIWIHCASVGEILTVKTLVKHFEKEFNNSSMVISTNTNTGLTVAKMHFAEKNIFYFPLDLSWIIYKVLDVIQPKCLLLIELEIWPNLLIAAARRRIPVVLLNARISEKSLKWYRFLGKISKKFLTSLTIQENMYCARSKIDAVHLMNLGISEPQVTVTGNMKFDNIITAISENKKKQLLDLFEIDTQDKVIICGSTHEGEEAIILKIFKEMSAKFTTLRLILAPRHIERIDTIATLTESMGFGFIKKTSLDKGKKIGEHKYGTVIIIDTVGELLTLYSIADCVFIGKSLVPQGGQNMMEPAGLAKPIIAGPHTFNFHEEVQLLKEADAIKIVQNESGLSNEMTYLLEHPNEAREMGRRAQSVIIKQKGATDRNLKLLRKILLKER